MVKLRAPFTYALAIKDGPVLITVPKGFVTDLASIPKRIDDLFGLNPSGRLAKAAVLHDYLYATPHARWRLARDVFDNRAQLGHTYVHALVGDLPDKKHDLIDLTRCPAFQRLLADRVFREAIAVPPRSGWEHVLTRVTAVLSYHAVRLFGRSAFTFDTLETNR